MIRVHFIGGSHVDVDGESLKGFREHLEGDKSGFVHYYQENLLLVPANVTHVEDLDAEMPIVEQF